MRLYDIRCQRCGAACQKGEWEWRKSYRVCRRCARDLRTRDAEQARRKEEAEDGQAR